MRETMGAITLEQIREMEFGELLSWWSELKQMKAATKES
jgi:hypothetical protein